MVKEEPAVAPHRVNRPFEVLIEGRADRVGGEAGRRCRGDIGGQGQKLHGAAAMLAQGVHDRAPFLGEA
jgi:hypothetical protein